MLSIIEYVVLSFEASNILDHLLYCIRSYCFNHGRVSSPCQMILCGVESGRPCPRRCSGSSHGLPSWSATGEVLSPTDALGRRAPAFIAARLSRAV